MPYLGILKVLSGVVSTLLDILKAPIKIPVGVVLACFIGFILFKNSEVANAIRKTIAEITAKAELDAMDAILKIQEALIAEKNKQLEEQTKIIKANENALKSLENQIAIDDAELKEAMDKINEISSSDEGISCSVDDAFIKRLRNQ